MMQNPQQMIAQLQAENQALRAEIATLRASLAQANIQAPPVATPAWQQFANKALRAGAQIGAAAAQAALAGGNVQQATQQATQQAALQQLQPYVQQPPSMMNPVPQQQQY
jgi:hypothetical protein